MKLEYNEYLTNLQNDDVLRQGEQLYLIERIKNAFEESFDQDGLHRVIDLLRSKGITWKFSSVNSLFEEGIDCKILRVGSPGWQSGKFKVHISVEFIPDEPEITEPESPLDEIRREISQLKQE
ncbi:KGK domain-containing protein [Synechocystis sp. LKSZ1]|uniref:KGK domain-containing protein n=1 Tax=Synechocystis sp. LKSZ1 TaxID=3144951 RepID=UPI00336C2658